MKPNQFRSLQEAALSVRTGVRHTNLVENTNYDYQEYSQPSELAEYVSDVIVQAEKNLRTYFTEEEIVETTNYIVGKLQVENLIESIENEVGFELNENEIEYVFNTLQNI